ncbi:unnamed protein product [Mesocestoides corti]|uniref:Usp domain-containing protein n=1 Tax=Mesocestoides corti TaxID=53468 RepID=A0A0R3U8M8_MESCO|nr:unnamed protein product [Mesocestoides corti]
MAGAKSEEIQVSGRKEGRRILFPIDNSENCVRAFRWYLRYVKKPGDFIVFIHVVEPAYSAAPVRISSEFPPQILGDLPGAVEEIIKKGKALGTKYMDLANKADLGSSAFLHMETKPGRAILTSAKKHSVDMIVMGSGGQGFFSRVFLGSVSDYVVHNSTIPVVIVHTEKD